MITDELTREERSRRWREVIMIYLIMTIGTVVVDQLASIWSALASVSVLIIALGFIFLPTEWLIARGESPRKFGIGGKSNRLATDDIETAQRRAWRSTKQALWISLLIFPLFIAGTHLWRTWEGREATLEQRAFARWEESARGFSHRPLSPGEVNLGASADRVRLRWKLEPGEEQITHRLRTKGAKLKLISKSQRVRLSRPSTPQGPWLITAPSSGFITLKTEASTLILSSENERAALSSGRYSIGEYGTAANENIEVNTAGEKNTEVRVERHFEWLWSIFLMQLFLVGLPEEIFYRGYLQTRLDSLVGQDRTVFGALFNWKSTILCSVLFALAHLATIHNPARLAVFFPSLLFGWMRRAYHDTLSPAIFHALCNVLSQLLWGVYALH